MIDSVSAPTPPGGVLYRGAFSIAALTAVAIVVFFVIGIADGSVSSFNIVLWLGILAATAAVLLLGRYLRSRGRPGLASAVLAILAVPGLLYGFFLLLVIITQPRWN